MIEETPSPGARSKPAPAASTRLRSSWPRRPATSTPGTVECIFAAGGSLPLEMNTRLRSSTRHRRWSPAGPGGVAAARGAGEPLPLTQEQVRWHGHAIEFRLWPRMPTPVSCRTPAACGLRWPQGAGRARRQRRPEGAPVSADPSTSMLAKVIAHGATRDRHLAAAPGAGRHGDARRHGERRLPVARARSSGLRPRATDTGFLERAPRRAGPAERGRTPALAVAALALPEPAARGVAMLHAAMGAWRNRESEHWRNANR